MTISMTKPEKCFLAGYLLFQLVPLPWLLQKLTEVFSLNWGAASLNFLYFLINFLAILAIAGRFLVGSVQGALKDPAKVLRNWGIWFLAYWLSSLVVSLIIVYLQPDFANVNDANISVLVDTNPTLMITGTVLLVPLVEECLYRGLLFGALRSHSRVAAYAVSVGMFCLVHVIGYISTYPLPLLALCLLQYIPAGICLARAYEASDNIFTPILIHTTINAIGMIAMR